MNGSKKTSSLANGTIPPSQLKWLRTCCVLQSASAACFLALCTAFHMSSDKCLHKWLSHFLPVLSLEQTALPADGSTVMVSSSFVRETAPPLTFNRIQSEMEQFSKHERFGRKIGAQQKPTKSNGKLQCDRCRNWFRVCGSKKKRKTRRQKHLKMLCFTCAVSIRPLNVCVFGEISLLSCAIFRLNNTNIAS